MPTPPDDAPATATAATGAAAAVLRDAADGDAAGLIALIGACFAAYPGCHLAVDAEMPELRAIASRHAALGGRFWIAEAAGRLVGSVGVEPAAGGAGLELVKLYVAPSARRQGLGARLVGRVEAEARARGARRICLWSDTRFTDAHRLYARLGFHRRPGVRLLCDLSDSREYGFVKPLAGEAAG